MTKETEYRPIPGSSIQCEGLEIKDDEWVIIGRGVRDPHGICKKHGRVERMLHIDEVSYCGKCLGELLKGCECEYRG